ncbi:MAG TPA: hypothetical protein VFR41_04655 [Acidimicrobiia bacterium]|nr:hypothetical protein [Acidimicrobiia bacterium]
MSLPPAQRTDSVRAEHRVDGRVVRGTREGQQPVANQWVVLHRVGPDRAGPLDSTRTAANGHFSLRYRESGDTAALYFASTSYGGVAYFTSPLRGQLVRGDDATLTVFDTTSGPVAIKIGGRHLIVGSLQANGRRPIGEVYDLQNDSTVTLVARDTATPVWRADLPASAVGFQLNTNGDVAPGAITQRGNTVGLFAPLSPGIRQFAFTYELPSSAFPLTIPIDRATGVLEVLVQDPTARVDGTKLRETAPVSADGRTFRRFLGQDLAAGTLLRIDVPRLVGAEREKAYFGVTAALLAAMIVALVVAGRRSLARRRLVAAAPVAPEPRSRQLLRGIAALDEEFEKIPSPDEATRADYETKRAALKAQFGAALADERRTT